MGAQGVNRGRARRSCGLRRVVIDGHASHRFWPLVPSPYPYLKFLLALSRQCLSRSSGFG